MRSKDALLGAALVVCWSSGFVGAELGTRAAPVETVLAWRTLVAALLLGGWAWSRGTRIALSALARQVVLGLLVQVLYLGGVFAPAGAGVAAGTSALVTSAQPLLVAVVAAPLLGERTTPRQRVGLVLALAGVLFVVAADLGGGTADPVAYLFPVVALLALAAGTVTERRWRPAVPLAASMAVQTAVAAVVFGSVALGRGTFVPPATASFWTAILWLVVLAAFGGYGTYLTVVRRSGAVRASTLLYLTPPTTTLWAWALFGDPPAVLTVPGIAVGAVGVALALVRSSGGRPASVRDTVAGPAFPPEVVSGADRVDECVGGRFHRRPGRSVRLVGAERGPVRLPPAGGT